MSICRAESRAGDFCCNGRYHGYRRGQQGIIVGRDKEQEVKDRVERGKGVLDRVSPLLLGGKVKLMGLNVSPLRVKGGDGRLMIRLMVVMQVEAVDYAVLCIYVEVVVAMHDYEGCYVEQGELPTEAIYPALRTASYPVAHPHLLMARVMRQNHTLCISPSMDGVADLFNDGFKY